MRIPTTQDDLEEMLREGLSETAELEVKQSLSDSTIKAVTGLALAGGLLIVGVEEVDGKPSSIRPLAGGESTKDDLARRITSCIRPVVTVHTDVVPVDGGSVLVVTVPPSPSAPHQYFKQGRDKGKFYGRDDSGNRVLAEDEVERLMARRRELRAREQRLPGELPDGVVGDRVELVMRAQPVLADEDLLTRAAGSFRQTQDYLEQLFRDVAADEVTPVPRGPDGSRHLLFARSGGWHPTFSSWVHGLDTTTWERDEDWAEVTEAATLTTRGVLNRQHRELVSVRGIVDQAVRTCLLVGRLYADAGYLGPVDLVFRLRGLRDLRLKETENGRRFVEDTYLRTSREPAARLAASPMDVANSLLERLLIVGFGTQVSISSIIERWRPRG